MKMGKPQNKKEKHLFISRHAFILRGIKMDPFADLLAMDTGAVVAAAAAVRETEKVRGRERGGKGTMQLETCRHCYSTPTLSFPTSKRDTHWLSLAPPRIPPPKKKQPQHDRSRDEDNDEDDDDVRPSKRQELEKRERKKERALKGPSLALALLADAAPSLTSEGDDWGWKIDGDDEDAETSEALDFRGWKGVEAEAEGGGITALDLAGVANSSSSAAAAASPAFCLPPPGVMPLLFPKLKRLSLGGNSLRALPDDLGGGGGGEEEEGESSGKEKGEEKGPSGGLEWLWLENNAFRQLPPQLSLVAGSLRHLSLALNPLAGQLGPRAVLASLRNLETLDLSECALEGVPDEIGELT